MSAMVPHMSTKMDRNLEDYYRPTDAARLVSASLLTLSRWADADLVRVIVLPSGHRRYLKADIDAIATQSGSPGTADA
jgi:predicted site-specific integrase-resolvase